METAAGIAAAVVAVAVMLVVASAFRQHRQLNAWNDRRRNELLDSDQWVSRIGGTPPENWTSSTPMNRRDRWLPDPQVVWGEQGHPPGMNKDPGYRQTRKWRKPKAATRDRTAPPQTEVAPGDLFGWGTKP